MNLWITQDEASDLLNRPAVVESGMKVPQVHFRFDLLERLPFQDSLEDHSDDLCFRRIDFQLAILTQSVAEILGHPLAVRRQVLLQVQSLAASVSLPVFLWRVVESPVEPHEYILASIQWKMQIISSPSSTWRASSQVLVFPPYRVSYGFQRLEVRTHHSYIRGQEVSRRA